MKDVRFVWHARFFFTSQVIRKISNENTYYDSNVRITQR